MAAWALRVRVTALNRVDLPTLGRPTIPACNIGRTDSGSRRESQIPIADGHLYGVSQSPSDQVFRVRPDTGLSLIHIWGWLVKVPNAEKYSPASSPVWNFPPAME